MIDNPSNTPNTTEQRQAVVNLETNNDNTPTNLVTRPSQANTTLSNNTELSDVLENARREVDVPIYENNSNATSSAQVTKNSSTWTNQSNSTSPLSNNNNTFTT